MNALLLSKVPLRLSLQRRRLFLDVIELFHVKSKAVDLLVIRVTGRGSWSKPSIRDLFSVHRGNLSP